MKGIEEGYPAHDSRVLGGWEGSAAATGSLLQKSVQRKEGSPTMAVKDYQSQGEGHLESKTF